MIKSLWIKILAAVLIIIFVIFVYAALRGGKPAGQDFQREDFGRAAADPGREFLRTLQTLQKIDFAESVLFTDQAFLALFDFSEPIAPQPRGRNNPFAPSRDGETFSERSAAPPAATSSPSQ